MSEWKIEQVKMDGSRFYGMWYAFRQGEDKWCEVRGSYFPSTEYLHADGEARPSTVVHGTWSGYFETEEQVRELI